MPGARRGAWVAAAVCVAILAGCQPVDPALEASMIPVGGRVDASSQRAGSVRLAPGTARPRPDPEFNPQDRVPNMNPRIVTNNVYGPGRSSDVYGRVVYHNPGLVIEQTAQGSRDYRDQYGRPVRCYGAGGGMVCR